MNYSDILTIVEGATVAIASLGIPVALTFWVRNKPFWLSPRQKLLVSLLYVAACYGTPFVVFPALSRTLRKCLPYSQERSTVCSWRPPAL